MYPAKNSPKPCVEAGTTGACIREGVTSYLRCRIRRIKGLRYLIWDIGAALAYAAELAREGTTLPLELSG